MVVNVLNVGHTYGKVVRQLVKGQDESVFDWEGVRQEEIAA